MNFLNHIDLVVHTLKSILLEHRRHPTIKPLCKFCPDVTCCLTNPFYQVLEMPPIFMHLRTALITSQSLVVPM
jgi:hypothetical protein